MERWFSRVAVVTGASSGIGADIVRALARHGMKVVGVARRLELVQNLAEELKKEKSKGEVFAVHCDVVVEDDVNRVIQWTKDNLGGVDVLVNNAGVSILSPLSDLDISVLRKMLDTNVVGLCIFTSAALKDMKSREVDDGHIIHINSIAGHNMPDYPGCGVYVASKHAVTVLTEYLRKELASTNSKIRVTSVSPGLVQTGIFKAGGYPEEVQKELCSGKVPILQGSDVANAVLYALSAPSNVQIHEVTVRPTGEKY